MPDPTPNGTDNILRPRNLQDYIGQPLMIQRLNIAIKAAKFRGEAMPHVLFHGAPGLGKTSAANLIAGAMGSTLHTTSAPALEKVIDVLHVLVTLKPRDVWFIDEIHRLPPTVEEILYPVLEDSRVDVLVNGAVINIPLPPFTLVGATTRAGGLSAPFRDRFGIVARLEYYPPEDLADIVSRSARILAVTIGPCHVLEIAKRARGTPRIANNLLARVRDFACGQAVTADMLDTTFQLEGIDATGMNELDRAYLACLKDQYKGGPTGVNALAASLNEAKETLENVVEPFLLYHHRIGRTPRGRVLLDTAAQPVAQPSEDPTHA